MSIPILFLAGDLAPSAASRHLARLATGLDPSRFDIRVAVLNRGDSPVAHELQAHAVKLRHALDLRGLYSLRSFVNEFRPKIVHAWGPDAIRATAAFTRTAPDCGLEPRVVASAASILPASSFNWWTRKRLRVCDRVVPATWVEAERYRQLGVLAERLTRIAPGAKAAADTDRAALLKSMDMPANARFVVAAGRLANDTGLRSAIWAFDLIHREFPDLYLAIVGDGPARAKLFEYAQSSMASDFRIRFVGDRADGAAIVAGADFAWDVHPQGDVRHTLEAMAAGVPVFAWRLPEMAELIDDGTTGILAEAGQPAQLATKTYPFLRDEDRRAAIGSAGRAAALERFLPNREIEHYAAMYSELA